MWDIRDAGCWECRIFEIGDVGDVGCWGCGMFEMWHV